MNKLKYPGKCELCGIVDSQSALAAHLVSCVEKHNGIGTPEPAVLIQFEGEEDPQYWLMVEARANATFQHLDTFLRKIWLECCGHMSTFRKDRFEISKRTKIGDKLAAPGTVLLYDYDMGSTTSLVVTLIGSRQGVLGKAPLRILARNTAIEWHCVQCPSPATLVCPYCYIERSGLFCDADAEVHEHADDDIFLPVVDSPRMGVCGYTGK